MFPFLFLREKFFAPQIRILLALACFLRVSLGASGTFTCKCTCTQAIDCTAFKTACEAGNSFGPGVNGAASCDPTVLTSPVCTLVSGNSCSGTSTTAFQSNCQNVCEYANFLKCDASSSCSSPSCFPAVAIVELRDGRFKPMWEVRIGDIVRVSPAAFSEVYMFTHNIQNITSQFIQIATTESVLELSSDHYLYLNGSLSAAKNARVGDLVQSSKGSHVAVVSVGTVLRKGLFNPQTIHGDIVVNGIVASTYTAASPALLAHVLSWPFRFVYSMGLRSALEGLFSDGLPQLIVSLTPQGS